MGKLKWVKELAKKGGSKIADIQKGTKPSMDMSQIKAHVKRIKKLRKENRPLTDRQYLKGK